MDVVRGHSESCSFFLQVTLVQTFEMTAPLASSKDVFAKQTYLSLSLHHNLSLKFRAFWKQCPLHTNNAHCSAWPSVAYCCYILELTHPLPALFVCSLLVRGLWDWCTRRCIFFCVGSVRSWVGGREPCCQLLMSLPILRRTCPLEVFLFFIPVFPEHLPGISSP